MTPTLKYQIRPSSFCLSAPETRGRPYQHQSRIRDAHRTQRYFRHRRSDSRSNIMKKKRGGGGAKCFFLLGSASRTSLPQLNCRLHYLYNTLCSEKCVHVCVCGGANNRPIAYYFVCLFHKFSSVSITVNSICTTERSLE